ncbi:MAG: helix-turn-helix transcriptional regulator [Cytophagales bacterium]|nr:helix-turn-helix transcriptional regulator [Cytophagales bacterium]
MKKSRLGEFQELILMAIIVLKEEAYGNSIQHELETRLEETVSIGAIQTALKRMEANGYVTSVWGEASNVRGGKRKRMYEATPYAVQLLKEMQDVRFKFWQAMPAAIKGTA